MDGAGEEEEEEEEGGGVGCEGVDRLNVSTWLVIQSDYHRLTAPTGRHPPRLPEPGVSSASQECE